ncbi:MAG TPA: hypothetical protein VG944_06470 [Fimbriimonas sp.]|nr:hypothetical protein [Fimbriimonas sp.]
MSDDAPLDPMLDGTGGGYGKFKGISVREVSQLFDRVAAEPNMRAFSAVLRISREQVEARGSLGMYSVMTILMAPVLAICILLVLFGPTSAHKQFLQATAASTLLFVIFGSAYLSSRKLTRASVAQERAIRDLAVDALERIATEPSFKPKPLDHDQKLILKDLLKRTKRSEPELLAMLQDQPEPN